MEISDQEQCVVCKHKFSKHDLYPLILLRSNVLNLAKKQYPDVSPEGFACFPDLHKISALRFEELIKEEKGTLTELEREVLESLKAQDILTENVNEEFEETLSFGEKLADKIASFGGSWRFIILFITILVSWMALNSFQLLTEPFDPYPYILLNLVLSCLAAIQAPVIMMSQNRQNSKDRLSQENDYQINLKSELQIRQLQTRLDFFIKNHWQKMDEISSAQKEVLNAIKNVEIEK